MITLKRTLETQDDVELHLFADEHIGDPNSYPSRVKRRVLAIADKPNAYAILNGDLINNAIVSSVSDSYEETMTPMHQLALAIDIFEPIKDKILVMTDGNHERRTRKTDGIDLSRLIAMQLGIEEVYTDASALLFLRFGKGTNHNRPLCYSIYVAHGSGGGRSEGAKVNRLVSMSSIVDADVYIHSHTHTPLVVKNDYYRTSWQNSSVDKITRLFVNTSSNLGYGGYGEIAEYKPSSNDMPVIYLSANKKLAQAKL